MTRPPAVVFLHGFLGSSGDWHDTIAHLSDGCCCIAIDLPGHGRTPCNLDTFDDACDHIIKTVASLNRTDVVLVGYSMGGRLALNSVLRSPQSFRMLVLESASPGLSSVEEREARRHHDERIAHELETRPFDEFLDNWYSQPVFASLKPEQRQHMKSRRLQNNPMALARVLRACSVGRQPPLWDRLPELTVPLRVVAGEKDNKYVDIAGQIGTTGSDVQVAISPGCGHNTHFESAEYFARLLTDWM